MPLDADADVQLSRLPRKPIGKIRDRSRRRKRRGRRVRDPVEGSPRKRSAVREALLPQIPKKRGGNGLSGYGGWHQKSAKLLIDRRDKEEAEATPVLPNLVPNLKPKHRKYKGRRDSTDKFNKACEAQFRQRTLDVFCRRRSQQVEQALEQGSLVADGEWGRYHLGDGSIFEGCYRNMLKHGKGIMKFDGNVYAGDFVDDVIHGEGKFTYSDGTVYVGQFHNGQRHGKGKMRFKNGDTFEGPFVHNRMHGIGEYIKHGPTKPIKMKYEYKYNKFVKEHERDCYF